MKTRDKEELDFLHKLSLFLNDMYLADAVDECGKQYLAEEREELIELCDSRLDKLHN